MSFIKHYFMIAGYYKQFMLILGGLITGISVASQLTNSSLFSSDTWWHLAAGKWIWENKAIPRSDPFSWSLPDAPWIAHEWLFEFLLYPFSGTTYGVMIFCLIPVLITLFFLWKLAGENVNPIVTGVLFPTVIMFLVPGLTARPQLFDYAFFALMIYIYSKNTKWIYIIPLITLIWANMHSAVLLGIGITLLYAVLSFLPPFEMGAIKHVPGEKDKLLVIAFFSILASMCTPWGYKLYGYVWHTVTDDIFTKYILEWMAPPLGEPVVKHTVIAAVILVMFGLLRTKKAFNLSTVILCGGLFYLTLSGYRYYSLFGIALALFLGELWREYNGVNNSRLVSLGVALGLFVGSVLGGVPADYDLAAKKEGYPVDAIVHIQEGDKVLNPYNWGGYLIYKGVPVFIDGRADIYRWEGDVFVDSMEKLGQLEVEKVIHKYQPDSILCRTGPIERYLSTIPGLKQTYRDDVAVIFKTLAE